MSDAAKPWEEDWGAYGVDVRIDGVTTIFDGQSKDCASARLAAAAPEMARKLLWLAGRWEGERRDPDPCASCGGEVENLDGGVVHLRDCSLLALLRKAGVLP